MQKIGRTRFVERIAGQNDENVECKLHMYILT